MNTSSGRCALWLCSTLALAAGAGCSNSSDNAGPAPSSTQPPSSQERNSDRTFTEITKSVKLDFVHDPGFGAGGSKYFMPESMAAGAALFDMDHDGDLDIYLINGANTSETDDELDPPRNRLFRNDGGETMVDVTASSGLGDTGYGMGVAVGDIDNDGDLDVYLTNYGADALYRNNGDATFTNISAAAGIENTEWGASAAFFDFDRDGFLDLFVTNYVAFDPSLVARDKAGRPDYPGPLAFPGVDDVLYHNNGDGTFTDVSIQAGITGTPRRGLGLACADFNGDDLPDVYVANDSDPNQLWINQGDGTFEDRSSIAGAAVNVYGDVEAGMGVALGDVDGDGDLDLFITHLVLQSNTLYRNNGSGFFEDQTVQSGLSGASIVYTGFGTAFLDYDDDGDLDLMVVNGRVRRDRPHAGSEVGDHWRDYAEPNLLFENNGDGRFKNVSDQAGPICSQVEVSRGLVSGDIDNDGDLDILITNDGGRARLFRCDPPRQKSWLMVRAVLPLLHRDAIGARIDVRAGGKWYRRDVNRRFSYLCSGDARVHFGLGAAQHIERLIVKWPDGSVESFPEAHVNQQIVLRKGSGRRSSQEIQRSADLKPK